MQYLIPDTDLVEPQLQAEALPLWARLALLAGAVAAALSPAGPLAADPDGEDEDDGDDQGFKAPDPGDKSDRGSPGSKSKRPKQAATVAPPRQSNPAPAAPPPPTTAPAPEAAPIALSGDQAREVARLLGGGLTAGDVQEMTLEELLSTANAAGISLEQFADAAGIPRADLGLPAASPNPAPGLIGLAALTGIGAAWAYRRRRAS